MHFTIVGAGAIGGLTGAYLAKHGEDVLFVDVVKEHVDAMNDKGLFVDGVDGEFTVPVRAALPEDITGPLDVVIIAVKSANTLDALAIVEPHLTPDSLVISMQNGLNPDIIAEKIGPERVAGGLMNWASDYIAPGHIRYGGAGDYFIGPLTGQPDARMQEIGAKLGRIMNTVVTDNVMGYLWSKECYGSLLIGTALIDAPVHEVLGVQENRDVLTESVVEAVRVADGLGVSLEYFPPFDPDVFREPLDAGEISRFHDTVAARFEARVKQHTGIWRDLRVRKRKTEVEALTGDVIRRGAEIGIDMPVNSRMVEMITEIERGEREQSWDNLPELLAVAR